MFEAIVLLNKPVSPGWKIIQCVACEKTFQPSSIAMVEGTCLTGLSLFY